MLSMSWRKEKKEHPWTTTTQAKRIASDHAKKEHNQTPKKGSGTGPTQTAKTDFTKLLKGSKRIAYQKKP